MKNKDLKKSLIFFVIGASITFWWMRHSDTNQNAISLGNPPKVTASQEDQPNSPTTQTQPSQAKSKAETQSHRDSTTSWGVGAPEEDREQSQSAERHDQALRASPEPDELVFSPTDRAQMNQFAWAGAGFKPPSTPGFDELFLKRAENYKETYSGQPLVSGSYRVLFAASREALRFYAWAFLKFDPLPNQGLNIQVEWWKWEDNPRRKHSTTQPPFRSPFLGHDHYDRILRLPGSFFSTVTAQAASCQEVSVVPHYDTASTDHIEVFNARVYCRTAVRRFEFMGMMTFRLIRKSQ